MANRNFNRSQNLEKEVKGIFGSFSMESQESPAYPELGAAYNFAVLASSTVTNTGSSVVTGDLGLSPGTSVTGFPPGTVIGTQHIANATASQAQTDLTAAIVALQAYPGYVDKSGLDLGTLTLTPGNYSYSSSAQLTGTLTLDPSGDPDAIWVIKTGSTLTTASASSINILSPGKASNVFFVVGSSATLGTTTDFKGNILAAVSITANTGATVLGRLLASTGAVTLDTNEADANTSIVAVLSSCRHSLGIESITRNSQGDYSIILEDCYVRLMFASFQLESALPEDKNFQLISEDVNDTREIRFRCITGAVETDPSVGSRVLMSFDLKNSSVGEP